MQRTLLYRTKMNFDGNGTLRVRKQANMIGREQDGGVRYILGVSLQYRTVRVRNSVRDETGTKFLGKGRFSRFRGLDRGILKWPRAASRRDPWEMFTTHRTA